MTTYRNTREVYETAADHADSILAEEVHVDPVDVDEWRSEMVSYEADRECIYTQDNWDVVNLFRCSPEMDEAIAMSRDLRDFDSIDQYMAAMAYYVWDQLIREALEEKLQERA